MASRSPRLLFVSLLSALSLGGCAYGDGYGYGGVSVGTGYAGNYYPGGFYDPSFYSGWYNDRYYPGTGFYVFDRGGQRYRWDNRQRSYWEAQRQQYRARAQARGPDYGRDRNNWRGRDGIPNRDGVRPGERRADGQPVRNGEGRRSWRQGNRPDSQAQAGTAPAVRPDRPAYRSENSVDRSATRAERPAYTPRTERSRGESRGSGRGYGNRQRPQ